jgi:hypothetical protein
VRKVKKGQVLADGPAIEKGELALGKNVLLHSCLGEVITLRMLLLLVKD